MSNRYFYRGIYENSNGIRLKYIGSVKQLGETIYYCYYTNIGDRSKFGVTNKGLKTLLKGFRLVQRQY